MAAEAPAQGVGITVARGPASDPSVELAIIVVDAQGLILGVDASFMRLTGYRREEVEGNDFKKLLDFDDPLGAQCGLFVGPQRIVSGSYSPKCGGWRPATLTLAPVSDGEPAFSALTIVLRPQRGVRASMTPAPRASVADRTRAAQNLRQGDSP